MFTMICYLLLHQLDGTLLVKVCDSTFGYLSGVYGINFRNYYRKIIAKDNSLLP